MKKMTLGQFEELFNRTFIIKGVFEWDASKEVMKDLEQAPQFDFENVSFETSYAGNPVGFYLLDNGMPCIFVNAGGDWEHPVAYIIWHDGNSFRAYVPVKGNVFNRTTKTAFGSEQEIVENELVDAKQIEGVRILFEEQKDTLSTEQLHKFTAAFEANDSFWAATELVGLLEMLVNPGDMYIEIMKNIPYE